MPPLGIPEWDLGSILEEVVKDQKKLRNFDQACPIFDMVFIDGCHDYEFIKLDTFQALHITRAGGLILWHDCTTSYPGVVKVVKTFIRHGVRKIKNTRIAYMLKM